MSGFLLRFDMKSSVGILEAQKMMFFAILGAVNFVNLVDFDLQKVQKFMIIINQNL